VLASSLTLPRLVLKVLMTRFRGENGQKITNHLQQPIGGTLGGDSLLYACAQHNWTTILA
jgi:hypothetical protein